MKRPILLWPHPALKKAASPFKGTFSSADASPDVPSDAQILLTDLLETMKNANGAGLAAPQINQDVAAVVVDISDVVAGFQPLFMINPQITEHSGKATSIEGCLSVPGFQADVPRSAKVTVKYLDVGGAKKTLEADGLLATALQHEIDHLDGIVFVERLSYMKKQMALSKVNKVKKAIKHYNERREAKGEPKPPIDSKNAYVG
jgi:peptide deformylase